MNRHLQTWLAIFLSMNAVVAAAVDIERPRIELVDKLGVNMTNGQVTHNLEIVSIGGPMGLSDSIGVHANEFDFRGYRGFQRKYYARARNVELSTSPSFTPRNLMRVHDPVGSVDFGYYVGGVLQQGGSAASGYTYQALGDERNTLEVDGRYLLWTKPDGTVVRFDRGVTQAFAAKDGILTSIHYPNGLTITVTDAGANVSTNTGFQLKSIYEPDNRPMDKPDNPNLINVTRATTSSASGWTLYNPKRVVGINASVEYCSWTASTCSLTHAWPTANFDWPPGMPRTMFIGQSTVQVTNSNGLTTTYRFKAYDLAYRFDQDTGGAPVTGFTPGREFSPRLIAIAPAGGNAEVFTYVFKNLFELVDAQMMGAWDRRLQSAGVVTRAARNGLSAQYAIGEPLYTDFRNAAGGVNGISEVTYREGGQLSNAYTDEGSISFEFSRRNWPVSLTRSAAPAQRYTYTRGNLTSITFSGPQAYSVAAEYPASCAPNTRKICNQATRTKDANDSWTDYAYHPESGQVSRVTHPANKHGIRPETRYDYTQLTARYYDSTGSMIEGPPIWMQTAEKYCINSAAINGVCTAGDEVVTRFEYTHDNLLMTGMTVTDPGGTTLRTCYQYDIYGNQIGKTQPKANLSSCP